MPTRERPADRGTRVAWRDLVRLGSELREARVSAGLSLQHVSTAVGISAAQISRIERSLVPTASVLQFARLGAVVGLDVRVRAYPGPDPIRDAGQVRVFERLRMRIPSAIRVRLEVPLPIPGDQRAWDATLAVLDDSGKPRTLRVEIETRITDAQAQIRRITLKMRDADVEHVLVVVADTPANRRAVSAAWAAIGPMFPVSGRTALAALSKGSYPGGSSLVFI